MMLLTRLPNALFLDYMSVWCGVNEIVKIDSSMCNKKDRIIFESILHSDHFDLIFDIDLNNNLNQLDCAAQNNCAVWFC